MASSSQPPVSSSSAPGASFFGRLDASGLPLLIARLIVGGDFIYTGWNKVSHPVTFLKEIHLYNILPEQYPFIINAMAVVLPWIEIVCGVLLVLGVAVRGSSSLLLVMLAFFTTAVFLRAWGIYQAGSIPFCAIKFDCGCGTGERFICHKLPENLGLMALAAIALFSKTQRFCLLRNVVPSSRLPWNIEGY